MRQTQTRIDALAARTADAFSFDRYGEKGWRGSVRLLIQRGYTDREAEAILRSKWMRWAADNSENRYGRHTGRDLARFLDDPRSGCTPAEVRELVAGTFGSMQDD